MADVIKFDYETTLGTDVWHTVDIPHTLDGLYVLGGSFRLKNIGSEPDDFMLGIFGTSEKETQGTLAKYFKLVQFAMHPLQIGETFHQEFMVPSAPLFMGHTNYQLIMSTADQHCEVSVNLVLKKA
jgi:hypothetical protein